MTYKKAYFKLKKAQCKVDCWKYFFSHRVVDLWNNLLDEVINSTILYAFQKRVLKFLRANDISYFSLVRLYLSFFDYSVL